MTECNLVSLGKEKNLGDYRRLGKFMFPDLSQYAANGRARGELRDGCLMTLTTNCTKCFSEARIWKPFPLIAVLVGP